MTDFNSALVAAVPHVRRMLAAKFRIPWDVIDDVVQDACIRALENQDKFLLGTSMQAWLAVIAANIYRSRFRTSKVRAIIIEALPHHGTVQASQFDHVRLLETFERIEDLAPIQRDAIRLALQGYSYEEMAKELEIFVGTVKSRVFRARKELEND